MALRSIKGDPGKFLDTVSGDVLDISDYHDDAEVSNSVAFLVNPARYSTTTSEELISRISKRLTDMSEIVRGMQERIERARRRRRALEGS